MCVCVWVGVGVGVGVSVCVGACPCVVFVCVVTKDDPQGSCNQRVWRGEELVAEYIQKRQQGW